jgi:hypothetical protein
MAFRSVRTSMLRVGFLLLGLTASVAQAATSAVDAEASDALTDDEKAEIVDFVVGNAVFSLYHQAGHMMMERFGVDAKGGERAADRFATMTLLEPRSGAGDQTLVDAVDSWQLASRETASAAPAGVLAPDRHTLDGDRAAAIVCDMVGADREGFADLADAAALSAAKRDACVAGYKRERAAFEAAVHPWRRAGDSPIVPLTVAYDAPASLDVAEATMLRDNHVLEEVADRLAEGYTLPEPPSLRARSCGEVTSLFDAKRNELVLCYELSAYHAQLILDDIAARH